MNIYRPIRRFTGILVAVALCILSNPVISAGTHRVLIEGALDTKSPPPVDMVDERPTVIGMVWNYSTQTVGWVWSTLRENVFSWITPPSPSSLSQSVSKQDAVQLFKLLGYAGYKLKEIQTAVGLIPVLNFKFGQSRELSEADYDYVESQMEEWQHANSGVYASLQRKIIDTLMAVNLSGEYRVSSLNVALLPLPDVAFTMSPKQTFLGEESSILMKETINLMREIRNVQNTENDVKKMENEILSLTKERKN